MRFFLSEDTRKKADFGTFPMSAGELETEGPRKGVYRNLCYFGYDGENSLVIIQSYRRRSAHCDYYFGVIPADLRIFGTSPYSIGIFQNRYQLAVTLIARKNRVAVRDLERLVLGRVHS